MGSGYVLTGGAEGVGGASGAVRPSERFLLGDEGSEGTGAQGGRRWALAWRRRRSVVRWGVAIARERVELVHAASRSVGSGAAAADRRT